MITYHYSYILPRFWSIKFDQYISCNRSGVNWPRMLCLLFPYSMKLRSVQNQNLGKIYGTSCKIWILTDYYVRNGIFEDFHPIDSSNWNESHTGSDNFHCPFGSKNPKKAKRKSYPILENGPWPRLLDKHIKLANGCFEEKLEPNGQSTARLALVLSQNKISLFSLLH